ncbi:hypothetical protein EIP91_002665 [Steccherinum ochraceum]|uniref:RRM domain-containing protein n=1 Tax=Steccherinum ochraceum TaxID=92696 RepID=A0A4R0RDN0_9APHY|nr:hypothetical protein EIP91_002665 [Steccherinum ochraceum]
MAAQQSSITNLGSQKQRTSSFGASHTPPLSFTPSLSASALHTPVSPATLSQSPRVQTPLANQLSSSSLSPQNFMTSPRESSLHQTSIARGQNQLSLAMSSSRLSSLSQNAISSFGSSASLPSLDSSSSISTTSPALSTPSTLSPAAPQFDAKPRLLDAPINIHALSLSNATTEFEGRTRTASGGISGSQVLSMTAALMNEGPTPTQESFRPLHLPVSSQLSSVAVSAVSPFAPPNPTTHIIEIDDSPIPPSEPSPALPSSIASPSSASGLDHPALAGYQAEGLHSFISHDGCESQPSQSPTDEFKTPNVYINGLPPNFPEEQLLAMTQEFGDVVSVRTFTRHVSDRPSGYGFVLFADVNGAEKCIDALRKYRNLHPSYSKRVHKIPGTTYAAAHVDQAPAPPVSSGTEKDTFKARMERLHDTASTNLYMEGLPMDINEPTLSALVSPYKIMSSRFFQTRLSVPARVIAFVRLESRTAAEEIIERLHGRMVRGWADTGCRISVRFADTSEQRELRRTERVNRDGEQSPSRLTVAQAALLNLKGGQLQTPGMASSGSSSAGLSPPFGMTNLPAIRGHSPSFQPVGVRGPGLISPSESFPAPSLYDPMVRHGGVPLNHGDAFAAQQMANRRTTPSPLPLQQHVDPRQRIQQFVHNQQQLPVIGLGNVHTDLAAYGAHGQGLNVRTAMSQAASPASSYGDAVSYTSPVVGGGFDLASARAQNGYTALEREILQKHLQQQQLQQQIRREDVRAAAGGMTTSKSGNSLLGRRLVDTLPSLSEEDFHAGRSAPASGVTVNLAPIAQPQQSSLPPSRLAMDDVNAKLKFTRQRNQTHSSGARMFSHTDIPGGGEINASEERARSTTMPEEYQGRRSLGGGDSYAAFSPVMNSTDTSAAQNSNAYNSSNGTQHNYCNSSTIGKNGSNGKPGMHDTSSNFGGGVNQNASTAKHPGTRIDTSPAALRPVSSTSPHITSSTTTSRSTATAAHARGSSDDGNASPLDSPALTYSNSARTPATLSPSTPFSAFAEGHAFESGVVVAAGSGRDEHVKGEVGLGVTLGGPGKTQAKEREGNCNNHSGVVVAEGQGRVVGRPSTQG